MAIRGAAGADEVLAALRRAPASGSMRAFAMERAGGERVGAEMTASRRNKEWPNGVGLSMGLRRGARSAQAASRDRHVRAVDRVASSPFTCRNLIPC